VRLSLHAALPIFNGPQTGLVIAGRLLIVLAAIGMLGVIWSRLHIPAAELQAYPPARCPGRWRRHMNTQAWWLRFAWLWLVLPLFTGIALTMSGSDSDLSIGDGVAILILVLVAAGIECCAVPVQLIVEPRLHGGTGSERQVVVL